MVVLKAKHSLHGKNLLPLALRLREANFDLLDQDALARLKKDHPLDTYSLEELEQEFFSLSGEHAADMYVLAGKSRSKETAIMLLNLAIFYANEVGAPKSVPLPRSSTTSVSSGDAPRADARFGEGEREARRTPQKEGEAEVQNRVTAMEKAIQQLQDKKEGSQVEEALRHIAILAGRPQLTSPVVIIAAVESLVDAATRNSHKDLDYYCKALQACRRFESSPDLCSLCMKLFGSQEDKKVSSAISEWSKQQKYVDKSMEQNPPMWGTYNWQGSCGSQAGLAPVAWSQQGWGGFPSPYQGYQSRPYSVPGGGGQRGARPRMFGLCHYCKMRGHFVADCPKLASKTKGNEK